MTRAESSIRKFIHGWIREHASAPARSEELLPTSNLIGDGLIDPLGFLNLIGALESTFTVELDFGDLDPETFTTIAGLTEVVVASGPTGT